MANQTNQPAVPNYTMLKTVVVVLGILLVVGFFALIAAMVYKASHLHSAEKIATTTKQVASNGTDEVVIDSFITNESEPRDWTIRIPANARLVDSKLSEGKLLAHLAFNDGDKGTRDQIWIIDVTRGRVETKIRFE